MIDGIEKRNRQLAFELENSHVCEKRSIGKSPVSTSLLFAKCKKTYQIERFVANKNNKLLFHNWEPLLPLMELQLSPRFHNNFHQISVAFSYLFLQVALA